MVCLKISYIYLSGEFESAQRYQFVAEHLG